MKKFCTVVICVMLMVNAHAQQRIIDSLKRLLVTAKEDTNKANILLQFGRYYTASKPDSALVMTQRGLELSRRLNYLKGQASALYVLGAIVQTTGNYPKSLFYLLSALKINEKINDRLAMAKNLGNISNIYGAEGDRRKAVAYLLKTKSILEAIHNDEILVVALVNLGNQYVELNKLDSARIFTQRAFELSLKFNDAEEMGYSTDNLGNIFVKMKSPGIAMGYYHSALGYFKQTQNDEAMSGTMLSMAKMFRTSGNADSALYYGRKSFIFATHGGFPASVLEAGKFLTTYFKDKGRLDSAFRYQEATIAAKDTLFSQEKVKEVQNISFTEQQRQQEIAEQKRLSDEANKRNLQLGGIAIFLPTFFLFVLFLSRRRIKARTVDFLGVLLLLLTFEFISMLIRPYISQVQHWAHDAPAIAMFINIGLATLLVPVHRPIERWVKHKLSHKQHHAELGLH